MNVPYYLRVGRASDLKDSRERKIFRALEIIPGALSWLTLIIVVLLSWLKPAWIAIFIISFIIYLLSRSIYFSFHLNTCYRQMRKNEKINWLKELEALPAARWQDIYHLIIIPEYKEPLVILRGSFKSLLASDYPKDKMIVVLSCEERAGQEAKEITRAIEKEFRNKFFKLLITYHPNDLPGELAGKGSNDAWGSRKAKELIIDPLKIPYENIIVSSFDADTCVFPKYFSCLTYHYLTVKKPLRSSFQPIPFYLNNIWQAPPISRIFSFSSSFWQIMKNVYKQQRRWAYGMGEIPYYIFAFWKNKKIPFSKKIFWGGTVLEGHWSWATNSIMVFLLGWLPLIIGGEIFSQTLLSYNLPLLTSRLLTLNMLGLIGSAYLAIMLLPPRSPNYGKGKYLFFILEWFLLPIIMIFFTALPALDAQTRWLFGRYMGYWPTPKIRK